jgi:hypothetical protein
MANNLQDVEIEVCCFWRPIYFWGVRGSSQRRKEKNWAPRVCRSSSAYSCDNLNHLKRKLQRVEELGGEGLIMRKKDSTYTFGRPKDLLRVKTYRDDEVVYQHQMGKGRRGVDGWWVHFFVAFRVEMLSRSVLGFQTVNGNVRMHQM